MTSGILSLPRELSDIIISFCGTPELAALSTTCKTLHAAAIPFLYREVDLSAHNQGRLQFTHDNGTHYHIWADVYPPVFDLPPLAKKQQSFLSTILKNPPLGAYVRIFVWTFRSYWEPKPINSLSFNTCHLDTRIWEVFQHLTNVDKLDLGSLHQSWDKPYLGLPPPGIFSTVTDLRLSGVMYRQVVFRIVESIDRSKLHSLELDNLQDPGLASDLYPHYRSRRFIGMRMVISAGPMRGVLPALQGHCSSLRSLSVRKPGFTWYNGPQCMAADEESYEEFAEFLCSVKMTIRSAAFEQGVPANWHYDHVGPDQVQRPMDRKFVCLVLPILMEESWPELRKVRIVGVERWSANPTVDRAMRLKLQSTLGEIVSTVLEDEAEKPCEYVRSLYG